ncbi:MAG TPA: endonuclease/exonuclease/phosphatase family protein [Chitinophagaceae bacterium]|nr:endonuclease/exonuclease/phosphatase family protein [Chitinophagaceae bacterium]
MEIVLAVVSFILIVSVFLSLARKDFWIYKILEHPRLQKLGLIIIVTGCWFVFWPLQKLVYQVILVGWFLSIIYLFYKILPYTTLSKKEMKRVKPTDPKNEFKVFSANVLQENQQYTLMLQQIKASDPDLIFLLETNAAWANAMQELENDYPYTLLSPLENTYGLLFYSRLKLENAKINFLVKNDVPSIEAITILPSGQKVQIWGLHPEPPVPGESLYSTAKDKELMKVALKPKDFGFPCMVFGDLNDVAWSHTTELFRKTSELLDPRRGRGFYYTFSAHHWYIRFPLDYIFCSTEFALITMRRLPKNGSDHFATLTYLALRKELKKKQSPPKADKAEMKEAHELATQSIRIIAVQLIS